MAETTNRGSSPVRTRFAPSPTGSLHVGGARVAVLNWLYARHHGGLFVLRIEDTDIDRNVAGAQEAVIDALRWLGIDWEEGPDRDGPAAPYRQSERAEHYRRTVDRLMERGTAYPCYCPPSEHVEGEARLLRCGCADGAPGPDSVVGEGLPIRFRVPRDRGDIVVRDLVRDEVVFPITAIEDFVLLRSDGRPTYNLAAAVDDHAMGVSHVIRGADHLSNTQKQILIFEALDWPAPAYAHIPLVLGADRQKLSKRHGAASVEQLRAEGYLPEAVVNYLSLLSWSSPSGEDFLPPDRLIAEVDLDRVGRADAIFDTEKLRWLSFRYIQELDLDELRARAEAYAPALRDASDEAGRIALEAIRPRISLLGEVAETIAPFLGQRSAQEEEARRAVIADPDLQPVLTAVRDRIAATDRWEADAIKAAIREGGKEAGARGPGLFKPVRIALTGRDHGPDLPLVIAALGRAEAVRLLSPEQP